MGLLREQCAEWKKVVSCTVAIGSKWKLVGRFCGMLLLSAKHSRSLVWWEKSIERRFGKPCKGQIITFGSLVEYYPISAKDQSRIHQFGKKVLPGIFLGYALYAGRIWKDDVLIADIEELEAMDASEIYSKRLNAKEVTFPKENGKFVFPVADGRIKFVGGDQELRTSTMIREDGKTPMKSGSEYHLTDQLSRLKQW